MLNIRPIVCLKDFTPDISWYFCLRISFFFAEINRVQVYLLFIQMMLASLKVLAETALKT